MVLAVCPVQRGNRAGRAELSAASYEAPWVLAGGFASFEGDRALLYCGDVPLGPLQ